MHNMISSIKYKSLSQSEEYCHFRNHVPLKKICVDSLKEKVWCIYDTGPRSVKCPLLCLPPAAGTADLFYLQLTQLGAIGFRVVAVDYPGYSTVQDWCEGFRKMMDSLEIEAPHILGASLSGFLAQKFSEYTKQCPRVSSLLLCHSYGDAADANTQATAGVHWMLPPAALRSHVSALDDHGCSQYNPPAVHNFAVEQVHKLSPNVLSSRLALARDFSFVQPRNVMVPTTLIDTFDGCTVRERAKNTLLKCYPDAKLAYFKHKTTLPYLFDPEQFNLYVKVHLKEFRGTDSDPGTI